MLYIVCIWASSGSLTIFVVESRGGWGVTHRPKFRPMVSVAKGATSPRLTVKYIAKANPQCIMYIYVCAAPQNLISHSFAYYLLIPQNFFFKCYKKKKIVYKFTVNFFSSFFFFWEYRCQRLLIIRLRAGHIIHFHPFAVNRGDCGILPPSLSLSLLRLAN